VITVIIRSRRRVIKFSNRIFNFDLLIKDINSLTNSAVTRFYYEDYEAEVFKKVEVENL
jgi:hypothetical protein